MFIADVSVLLSPYVSTILRQVQPSSFAVSSLVERAIKGSSFPGLAEYWGVDQARLEPTHRVAFNYLEALSQHENRADAEVERGSNLAHIRREIARKFEGDRPIPKEHLIAHIITEEISGAIKLGCPILAVGSPIPKIWEAIKTVFPDQTATVARELVGPDPTSIFRELQIPFVVLAELHPWLINVLPPSERMVGFLAWEQFLGLFRFVAYSIQAHDSSA